MKIKINIEVEIPDVPCASKFHAGYMYQVLFDHVLNSAVKHHMNQCIRWSDEPNGPIYKVHKNWAEWLDRAEMSYEVVKRKKSKK